MTDPVVEPGEARVETNTLRAELEQIAARYPVARSALLPMLHLTQSYDGCVTDRGMELCADVLGLTPAEVRAVASFYTMYHHEPVGTHLVGVCTNTLCAVMGGDLIHERLQQHLAVPEGGTSADGQVTLERIECNAACDYAPVVMVDWEFFDDQTPDSAVALVDRLRAGEPVTATRGARLTCWRDVERVLAGFEDGRADEGPSAGAPSLAGLETRS
jgi:NADH-quinone oxidoreductase subunit E